MAVTGSSNRSVQSRTKSLELRVLPKMSFGKLIIKLFVVVYCSTI
jgi:hypothetical protein